MGRRSRSSLGGDGLTACTDPKGEHALGRTLLRNEECGTRCM